MNHQTKTERAIHGLIAAAKDLGSYKDAINDWQESFETTATLSPYVVAFKEHIEKAIACLHEMASLVEGHDDDRPRRGGIVSEYTDLMGDTIRLYDGATSTIVTIQRHGEESDDDHAVLIPHDKVEPYLLKPLIERMGAKWR
jgi:hypothetical protein